jgi:chromosome partitioning protein
MTSTLSRPEKTRVMVIANQKGGVGKTTTTVNLGASLAEYGQRVLIIDLDPQGNASTALGIDHHAEVPSIYDVLLDDKPLDEVTQRTQCSENLFCVPATIDLAGAEIELVSKVSRETKLHRAIRASNTAYDYILIDCPPSLGLLTINALTAGQEVLIPIQTEYYALEGVGQLMKTVTLVKNNLNEEIDISTVLLTMYDQRTRLSAEVAEQVRTHFGRKVLRTVIPRSVKISEAPSHGETILTYDPTGTGAMSYRDAARELATQSTG